MFYPPRPGGCPCPLLGASSPVTSLSLSFLNSTHQDFVHLWPPFSRPCRRARPFPGGADRVRSRGFGFLRRAFNLQSLLLTGRWQAGPGPGPGSAGRALPSVSVPLRVPETLPARRPALGPNKGVFVRSSQFCRERQVQALSRAPSLRTRGTLRSAP